MEVREIQTNYNIHTHTHTHTHMPTDTHTFTYTHPHTHAYRYTHIHIHTYIHVHTHTCTHKRISTSIQTSLSLSVFLSFTLLIYLSPNQPECYSFSPHLLVDEISLPAHEFWICSRCCGIHFQKLSKGLPHHWIYSCCESWIQWTERTDMT